MSHPNDLFPHKKWKICDVISPELEKSVTQNFACRPQLPLLLPIPNFILIGASEDRF